MSSSEHGGFKGYRDPLRETPAHYKDSRPQIQSDRPGSLISRPSDSTDSAPQSSKTQCAEGDVKQAPVAFNPSIQPNPSSPRSNNLPNLSIRTQTAASVSATQSVRRARSPLGSGEYGQSLPSESASIKSGSSSSPISPRTRPRGSSLRRSVFARRIHGQSSNGSPAQSQVAATSRNRQWPAQLSESSQPSKESDATVTVSPTLPDQEPTKLRLPSHSTSDSSPSLPRYEVWARSRAARASLRSRVDAAYERIRKKLLRVQDIPPSKDGRHITLDPTRRKSLTDERTGRQYLNNAICSSKYTVWNFLPRQLFAQFSKLANFYFLCVSILQMIPGLSTTGNYTTIVPLAFFVIISMAKEGYEDIRRYKLDKTENTKTASVLQASDRASGTNSSTIPEPRLWTTKKWTDVVVGEVVRLKRDETAPADLALLQVDGANGIAYFETMALDGETNLKSKQASPPLGEACHTMDGVVGSRAHLVVEDPNMDLYKFEGKVNFQGKTLPLTNSEIVYRGSILRNTQEAVGMVVYTGEECKIRMNATKNPRIKAPALQFVVNRVVVIIVAFVLALAIFNTVAYQIWKESTEEKAWYLVDAGVAFFPILTSFIILFNTMIPLSLYVSLEIVKLFQLMLMDDIEMYDEDSNTAMEARTSTINEELGQVNYVFSDKTGTLTNNSMRFRKMSIAGTAWLHNPDVQEDTFESTTRSAAPHRQSWIGKKILTRKTIGSATEWRKNSRTPSSRTIEIIDPSPSDAGPTTFKEAESTAPLEPFIEQGTQDLLHYIQNRPHTNFAKKVRFFLLAMALCHTCLPERDEHGNISYQAASPDEAALVRAAQELGYVVIDRQTATITIKRFSSSISGESICETYQILDVIEFSSTRKRMSVLVRFPDQRICVFCKGADSMIVRRLRLATLAQDQATKVEQRVIQRQSQEAQEAIRRNSEQQSRKSSITRTSFSMQRHSIGGVPRPSMVTHRLRPIRDELDEWLTDRETDVDLGPRSDLSAYSPRPSHTLIGGSLSTRSEEKKSFQNADDEVGDLVDEALVADDATVFERCFQHINDFATEGLRTLLYGCRFLSEEEYGSWRKVYLDASTSLVNRQELVERAGELVEQDFELMGATAIEDKLQDGVPETIEKLRRAKIKLWMLTGDKRETAINIGHSCRLIKGYSSITVLDHETGDVSQRMAAATLEATRGNVAHSVIVIDGQTLAAIEADKITKRLFLDLAILVDSVICCRASPSQKAWLVGAIRRQVKNAITLAIGDGANDIAMIQEAHVGIGITGKEGLQGM